MTFMAYTDYQPGDEDILLDSSMIATSAGEIITDNFEVSVYPNPAHNTLYLQAALKSTTLQMQILNSLGLIVKNFPNAKIPTGYYSKQLDISDLTAGIYFLKIRAGDHAVTKKIVKLN